MTPRRRRSGFTLIEMLVVMAILAALAALAAGTYFQIKQAQTDTASERIVVRLSTGLERLTKAVHDQAKQEVREDRVPNGVRALARVWPAGEAASSPLITDIDRDRLVGIWAYLKLKAELPQTFDEARAGVWISVPTGAGVPDAPRLAVAPKPAFVIAARAGLTTTSTPTALTNANSGVILLNPDTGARDYALESAALLYAALAERGVRGELAGDEIGGPTTADQETGYAEVQPNGTVVNGTTRITVRVFRDAAGVPITFVRHATNEVILVPPSGGAPAIDPLDPQGRLARGSDWNRTAAPQNLCLLAFHRAARHPLVPVGANVPPAVNDWGTPAALAVPLAAFPGGQRWVTTVVAAGGRGTFVELNAALTAAFTADQTPLVFVPRGAGFIFSHESR